MTKMNIAISIDVSVYEKHKARGSNISGLCNTFLANYGQNIKKLKEKAILKTSEMVEALEGQKKEESKAKELKKLLAEALKYRALDPGKSHLILVDICDGYGLTWAEAVRRMEQK